MRLRLGYYEHSFGNIDTALCISYAAQGHKLTIGKKILSC